MSEIQITSREQQISSKLTTMSAVLGVAVALINKRDLLTEPEVLTLRGIKPCYDVNLLALVITSIQAGRDPLGEAYSAINSPESRRGQGQTFTPDFIIDGMFAWAKRQGKDIERLVDPGAGSGRYTLAGLRAFPKAKAVASELDPKVAIILRANLAAAGLTDRAEVQVADFRNLDMPSIDGTTLFVGNPPYVRHHEISTDWKNWYSATLKKVGHNGSQLAGLHLHFFLKTLELASPGDLGCYVTAAEWLDVKYGSALRQLLTNGLGGMDVFVVDPAVRVFGDALVSAAITCFSPSSDRATLRFAEVTSEEQLRKLASGEEVSVETAKAESKWTFLVKGGRRAKPQGFIELGEMFKVSRGQVTGMNQVWVENNDAPKLPGRFLLPTITDSSDITQARQAVISDAASLKRLTCLPRDLDALDCIERASVERFLKWARSLGAHETYIAKHRNPWWSVGTKEPASIVMTYMGRRPPVFAINQVGAQIINVAHGLYPRDHFSDLQLSRLVAWLNVNVLQADGRIYAGGLTKFEPSEAMRILIPETGMLAE